MYVSLCIYLYMYYLPTIIHRDFLFWDGHKPRSQKLHGAGISDSSNMAPRNGQVFLYRSTYNKKWYMNLLTFTGWWLYPSEKMSQLG